MSGLILREVRNRLRQPSKRFEALCSLANLRMNERKALLRDLVELVSVGHSDIQLCRVTILNLLPRVWVLSHIDKIVQSILEHGTDEEYRRLLELYLLLDDGLTQQLIQQALQHPNIHIQEVGMDFDILVNSGHKK